MCSRSSGVASASADGTWTKWTVWPSISVRKFGTAFIRFSWARQSNVVRHRSTIAAR